MKKILVLTVGLLMMSSLAYAAKPASDTKTKTPLIEKTQGKINTMTKIDQAKKDFGGFTVLTDGGESKEFKLIAKTKFYSPSSSPMAFSDFKKGDRVTILSVVTLRGDNDVITVTQNK